MQERQRSEVRGQRSEVRGQRSEVRGQRSEVRGQRAPRLRLLCNYAGQGRQRAEGTQASFAMQLRRARRAEGRDRSLTPNP